MAKQKLGEILLAQKLITPEQLEIALREQQRTPGITLGQVLCRLGSLSEADLNYVLEYHNKREKLGSIVAKLNYVSEADIQQAQKWADKEGKGLEIALRELDILTDRQLANVLAKQYDLPCYESGGHEPDLDDYEKAVFAGLIPQAYAIRHRVAVVSKIGSTITLAMARPLPLNELRILEQSTATHIIPVITTEREMSRLHTLLYGMEAPMDFSVTNASEISFGDETVADENADSENEALRVTEKDSVIMKLANRIIVDAWRMKASDIHVEPYPGRKDVVVRVRVDGVCRVLMEVPYRFRHAIIARYKIMAQLDIAERRKPQDGKIDFSKFSPHKVELRVATLPTVGGLEDVVLRILAAGEPLPLSALGMRMADRENFARALARPYGLILVVGPTGSGKTTTLHSGLSLLNNDRRKIWTAEDPVEIVQAGLRQLQVHPKIGLTFAAALRSFLRADPDVIMVGEIRDLETATIAVEASLTGHLVLSTLHTNSAPETVTRLLDMGVDPFLFADSLLCVVAQRLVKTLCPNCKASVTTEPEREQILADVVHDYGTSEFASDQLAVVAKLTAPVGCEQCGDTGYRGRLGVYEVLVPDDAIKEMLTRKADAETVRRHAVSQGMRLLRQDALRHVIEGNTTIEAARAVYLGS